MKNEQLYNETVDIILDAYNKRQLRHTVACGCFIGNIVAKRMFYTKLRLLGDGISWIPDFTPAWLISGNPKDREKALKGRGWTMGSDMSQEEFIRLGDEQIASTGYTPKEVMIMERAFERAKWDERDARNEDVTGIRGMRAALVALAEIHETKEDESIMRLEKIYKEKYDDSAHKRPSHEASECVCAEV